MKEFFNKKILKPTNEMAKLAGLNPINMESNYPPNIDSLDTGINDIDEEELLEDTTSLEEKLETLNQ